MIRKVAYLVLVGLLAACNGGGHHSPNNCADSRRGCPIGPDEDRGNQSHHKPSDRNEDGDRTPSDRDKDGDRTPSDRSGRGRPNPRNASGTTSQLKFILGGTGKVESISVDGSVFERIYNSDEYRNEDEVLTYNSVGKEMGLSYSDFGTYIIINNAAERVVDNAVFSGGNDAHRIQPENITTDLAFTGRAVGKATKLNENVDLDGKAVLNFDAKTGVSDLWAYFGNWYDVNVKSNGDIEFSNYTNTHNEAMLSGDTTASGAEMDIGYYGPDTASGRPTEATGTVHYEENIPDGVELNMAFGAK